MEQIKKLINHETFISASDDILKIGALFLGGRLLSQNSIMDATWIQSTVFLLLGFLIYHIIVRHIINPMNFVDMNTIRIAIEDIIKFGIAFLFARLIAKRNNMEDFFNKQWISEISIILAGFAIYDIIFSKLLDYVGHFSLFGISLYSLSDVFKFGTMLIVVKYFTDGNILYDRNWQKETLGALGAVALYDIFSRKALSIPL